MMCISAPPFISLFSAPFLTNEFKGRPKYELVDVKAMMKKKISETDFHDRTHFVLDVDNELKTVNQPSQ